MDKKYNLLVLASTFPRHSGDTEPRFVYDLCQNLKNRFNITVLVPSFPGAAKHVEMEGLDVVRFRYALNRFETLAYPGAIMSRIHQKKWRVFLVPGFILGMYLAIKKLCKSGKYDVVHVHWLVPQGAVASFIKKSYFPPYLLTGHGGDVTSLNKGALRKLKERAISKAGAVTLVSQPLYNYLLSSYSIPSFAGVCPMGCDTTLFSKSKSIEDFYETHYSIKDPVILFVGRLAEKKGLHYLLEALTLEPIKSFQFHLVIVGEGPLKNELLLLTEQLHLSQKVSFVGAKTHEELPAIYASADVFCVPSITAKDGDQEGFPTVIIEAAASGIPIVTTMRDDEQTIIDNETGIMVEQENSTELAQALARLVESKDLRERMGSAGANFAKQFDWRNIAEKYEGYLLSVVNRQQLADFSISMTE